MAEKKSLAVLVDDQLALDNLLLEVAGDITNPETEEIVHNWISEVKSGIATKVDSYEFKQEAIKSQIEKFKSRAEMFTAAARALANLSESLKDRLKFAMLELDATELNGNLFRYKLSNSKPTVQIYDESKLPKKFLKSKTTYSPDKEAIKAAIDAGEPVSGACLEMGFTLRVYASKGNDK